MSVWAWAWESGHVEALVVWAGALIWGAVCCVVLVRTDLREHRLPNKWTARLALGGLVGSCGGAVVAGRGDLALAGAVGGLGYGLAMMALHVLSRGGLGMGDVKLAVGLGLYVGVFAGTAGVLAAGAGAVLLGGLAAVVVVVTRRGDRSTALPFGPAMVAAAGMCVLQASLS